MSFLVDFHCHLDLFQNFEELVTQCERNKVYTLAVTTTPRAWAKNKAVSEKTKYVRAALGLHPQLVAQYKNELDLLFKLIPETRYIGEVGIDGSKDYADSTQIQTEIFRSILQECSRTGGGKIFSIHSRGAEDQVIQALEENKTAGKPILHWYTGSIGQLDKAIKLDCWFSVGPAMLNTKKGIAITERIPRNRLLTETDGPFAKIRDIPLLPLNVENAINSLTSIWGVDYPSAKNQIYSNLQELLKN